MTSVVIVVDVGKSHVMYVAATIDVPSKTMDDGSKV